MDSRVHFMDAADPWSGSRHAAVLNSLDQVEKKLVTAMQTIATAISQIEPRKSSQENVTLAFNKSATEFLQLVQEIHTELANHLHLVSDYRVYGRSVYGAEKDLDLARDKVHIILSQLRELSKYAEDHLISDDQHQHQQHQQHHALHHHQTQQQP